MTIEDKYGAFTPGLTGPIIGGFDVTPDDATDLALMPRGIMVTNAGDVAVVLPDDTTLTLPGLAVGNIYPVRVKRILATGTTATGIKGLY